MFPPPSQVLFDRIVRSWIAPAANKAVGEGAPPIVLGVALILWMSARAVPEVYFNDDVWPLVRDVHLVGMAKPAAPPIQSADVLGLRRVRLHYPHHQAASILVCQGRSDRLYVHCQGLAHLTDHREFLAVERQLARQGVRLEAGQRDFPIQLDLVADHYIGVPPHVKRRLTLQEKALRVEIAEREAVPASRRRRKLPPLMAVHDEQVMALLVEARETYVDGRYFSAVAAAATAADRILLYLVDRYGVSRGARASVRSATLGQKLEQMRSLHLISGDQEENLRKLNDLRNRYLHPKRPSSGRAAARDARRALLRLHKLVDETLSVLRDYTIVSGRLSPRPLS